FLHARGEGACVSRSILEALTTLPWSEAELECAATGGSVQEGRCGFSARLEEFRPQGRTVAGLSGHPIGRGQMARRRSIRDAIEDTDCRFASPTMPALTIIIQALNVRGSRPSTLNPFAPQCATPRMPPIRRPLVGARVRGAHYGDQENAGGCHPPGRNTDCRYRR